MPVAPDLYRRVAGSFPTGVAIVTARDAAGEPRGLTTQSFIGLSLQPPLVLVALDTSSRTLPALKDAGAYVVNILRFGSEDVATLFASKSENKFAGINWRPSSIAAGAPILVDHAVAYAECTVVREIEAGDHRIFIGSVDGAEELGGIPLMYYRRTYAAWPVEKPAPPVS